MSQRLDEIDMPCLDRLQAECSWFRVGQVFGRGLERMVSAELDLRAFAWKEGDVTPTLRPGLWKVQILLARGMAVQPLVRVQPDPEGYLPAGGNISDWEVGRAPCHAGEMIPGLVCYADRWNPQFTLAWLAYQVARIVVGEVLNLEARPLSARGRNFQADALAEGKLPTQVIPSPPPAILFLQAPDDEPADREIEFHAA
ncbi:MAG: hypothetical protein ABSG86_26240 [Thermoguttaceae bacterium]|jgi:hypothetical protein